MMPDMVDPSIQVTVRCFASVRELLGQDVLVVAVPPGTTVAGLRDQLARQAPGLARLALAFAVNRDYAPGERVLAAGDEVVLVPPISGGSGGDERFRFDLSDGVLDARALEAECRTDQDGAVVTFQGTTRDHNQGAAVVSLRYEAYAEMAQKVVGELFELAARQFPLTRARIAHRLGEVPVGAASVVVVVAAAHRGAAFDACRFLMDRLKHEAPIWKRELLRDDGGERWVGDLPQPSPR